MKKVLLGVGAAIVVAAAGYFGFNFYLQHKVQSQVDAAFAQIRASGAKASHGKVSFDVRSRTVTIADIVTESASEPPFSVKIASVTASGINQPDPARFSAESIDIADVDIGVAMVNQAAVRITYKVPRIAVKDYSGPAAMKPLPASSSLLEVYRFGLAQLASITAASITAPSVTGTFVATAQGGASRGDYTYSGIAIEGIKDGKIASTKADAFHFKIDQPGGNPKEMTGDLATIVSKNFDVGALAAAFDPRNANDDREYRIHGPVSAGPYVITTPDGLNMRIDGMTTDDFWLNPSRLQLPKLMAMISLAGAAQPVPGSAQAREMMESVANLYQSIRIGNTEVRGLSVETPQGPLKLEAIRFNLANGKIGEFAFEGLDARAPKGPVKLGRLALKSLDLANLMRVMAQFSADKPSTEQALAMLPMIEGIEIKALTAPDKNTGKQSNIDVFSLDWGQFVGPIPSKLHLVAKMSTPLVGADLNQRALIAAGIDKITLDADLGAAWTEASRSFALEPVKLDLGGLLNATARLSLVNVSREVFSTTPAQAMGAATQIEVDTIELTMRDQGGVDLAIAEYARMLKVSRDAARQAIVETIRNAGTGESLKPAADALVNFIETPGQMLVIKLTPLAKAPALQLIQLLKTEPMLALAQFRIEASSGL